MVEPYPRWRYYPAGDRPPEWVPTVVDAFRGAQDQISSLAKKKLNSDSVLKAVRPALEPSGFAVEASKKKADKIRRPVLFGEEGTEALAYEVDAFHPALGIALEVEAGRGALGNADYRDLIQTSLLVDAQYLVLAMALEYHYKAVGKPRVFRSYAETHARLDAIYASQRLVLPLSGVVLDTDAAYLGHPSRGAAQTRCGWAPVRGRGGEMAAPHRTRRWISATSVRAGGRTPRAESRRGA